MSEMSRTEIIRKDAVVVGAGTAGSGAARALAQAGLRVALLDSRPAGKTGARWCNAIVPWQFARAGVPFSEPPELRASGGTVFLIGPTGHRVRFDDNPVAESDMRLLTDRLQADALQSGCVFFPDSRDLVPEFSGDRLSAVTVRSGRPAGTDRVIRLEAPLFVDASGRNGVLRSLVPALRTRCPEVPPQDLCSANHFVFELKDRDGARRFMDEHGVGPGDVLNWLGFAGGFSALMIRVELNMEEVSVLTGSLAEGPWEKGPAIMERVRRENPWIGKPLFGGGALIPLRRPYDILGAGGVALVGDAASQVFPAHGSGIGFGLMAGKVLAEAVENGSEPGSDNMLWDYQCRFHREFGGTLAAFDVMRRMSTAFGTEGVGTMFAEKYFSAESSRGGLLQEFSGPPPAQIPLVLVPFLRNPAFSAKVVPWLVRSAAVRAVYPFFPSYEVRHRLLFWQKLRDKISDIP